MGFVHGKGTVVSVNAADMTVFSTSCEYELKAEAHETTTFGQESKAFSGGLKESSLKLEGNYDDTAVSGPRDTLEDTVGTVIEIIYKPEGTGVGKPVRTFMGLLTNYGETSKINDMIKFTAQFQGSGDVVVTTT